MGIIKLLIIYFRYMKLPVNEGKVDRGVRISLGVVFLFLAMSFPPLASVFILIAIVLVATGALGFCALYKIFKINTCNIKE